MPTVVTIRKSRKAHVQPILFHEIYNLQGKVVRIIEKLDRSGLEKHGLEIFDSVAEADHDKICPHF